MDQRLSYLEFTEEDGDLLREMEEYFRGVADEVMDQFYAHLLCFSPLREIICENTTLARVKALQREYFLGVWRGVIDEGYVKNRSQVGRRHDQIGLEMGWYLGSYQIYNRLVFPVLIKRYREDPDKLARSLLAFTKLTNLDMQLATDAYIDGKMETIKILNEGLRRQVKESRDTQAQLVQAGKLTAIGELASNVAHEINNPLTTILNGAMFLLEELPEGDHLRDEARLIMQEAERAGKIVRGLLDFARQSTGERELSSLNQVLTETLRLTAQQATFQKVEVTVALAEGLPLILVDDNQMKQVILNLVNNALQAMPQGGELLLSTGHNQEGVFLRVKDSGSGIPAEQLNWIFEPFFTTKEIGVGTGLGLSVSLGIVKSHGGDIQVESFVGRGTTFTITLPEAEKEGVSENAG